MNEQLKLKMNLQHFAEGDEPELTLDQEIEEFNKGLLEDDDESGQGEGTGTEPGAAGEPEPSGDESTETPEEPPAGEPEPPTDGQQPPQDERAAKAFQEMRQKLQEYEKYAGVIQKIATQSGTTPEQIIQEFERRQLQQEAERQNVPVEVLERLQRQEQELSSLRNQQFSEKFNSQVEETKNKYNLDENEIKETVQKMGEMGLDVNRVTFEQAYKLINHDKIVEKQIEEARQKELAEKQKRQKSSAVPHKSASKSSSSDGSLSDEEFDDIMNSLRAQGANL